MVFQSMPGKRKKPAKAAGPRSACPITMTLDIIGDKWTLIILRDLFTGKSQYNEFLASPEGITTNILADRLKRLTSEGLVEKTPYQTRPLRYDYTLSEKGVALQPILQEICLWANEYIPDTWIPPASFMEKKKSG